MKYILEIDDSSDTGKHLIGLLKSVFSKKKGIRLLTETEIEEKEDALLGRMMEDGLKTGLANKEKVLRKLKLNAG